MVKFGKKFFFDENDNKGTTKNKSKGNIRKSKNDKSFKLKLERVTYYLKKSLPFICLILFIVIIILGIKACQKQNEKKKIENESNNALNNINKIKIKKSITILLGQEVPTIDKFISNYDNVKSVNDSIKYDETNLQNNIYTSVGEYTVTITIKNKDYISKIIVVDNEAPTLVLKDVLIEEGATYSINDFVSSCIDNSAADCAYSYVDPADGRIAEPGTHTIKIIASDLSGNKTDVQNATLTINAKTVTPTPTQKPNNGGGNSGKSSKCQFGDGNFNKDTVLTYSVVKNGCAIDPAYAKTDTYIGTPEKMIKTEFEKFKQQIIDKNNFQGKLQFDVNVTPVFNTTKAGLVGYTAQIIATNYNTQEELVNFYLASNGTRVYKVNKLGI